MSDSDEGKICIKCGLFKLRCDFYNAKINRDGSCGACKSCINAYRKKLRDNNQEREAASRKKWQEDNQEKVSVSRKKYRDNNPEKVSAQGKKWYKDNPEKSAVRGKKYRDNNPEKVSALSRKWRDRLPDSYVLKLLRQDTDIPREAIPNELIVLKRTYLKLKRLLKDEKHKYS